MRKKACAPSPRSGRPSSRGGDARRSPHPRRRDSIPKITIDGAPRRSVDVPRRVRMSPESGRRSGAPKLVFRQERRVLRERLSHEVVPRRRVRFGAGPSRRSSPCYLEARPMGRPSWRCGVAIAMRDRAGRQTKCLGKIRVVPAALVRRGHRARRLPFGSCSGSSPSSPSALTPITSLQPPHNVWSTAAIWPGPTSRATWSSRNSRIWRPRRASSPKFVASRMRSGSATRTACVDPSRCWSMPARRSCGPSSPTPAAGSGAIFPERRSPWARRSRTVTGTRALLDPGSPTSPMSTNGTPVRESCWSPSPLRSATRRATR